MKTKLVLFITILICANYSYAQLNSAMTFNIRLNIDSDKENNWHFRKAESVDLIKFYAPDVMGVQEATPHQMDYLDSSLTNYSFVGVGRDDGKRGGEFSALFYNNQKLKVIESSTFWLSETPDKVSFGWDAVCRRVCTYALLENKQSSKRVWVFNTHFDHKGEKARLESMNLIILKIKKHTKDGSPVVFMGDLNMTPEHVSIQAISKLMKDAYKISQIKHYGPTGTFNGFNPQIKVDRRIDYIFVKDLRVKKHVHIADRRINNLCISDHFPVMVEFVNN